MYFVNFTAIIFANKRHSIYVYILVCFNRNEVVIYINIYHLHTRNMHFMTQIYIYMFTCKSHKRTQPTKKTLSVFIEHYI